MMWKESKARVCSELIGVLEIHGIHAIPFYIKRQTKQAILRLTLYFVVVVFHLVYVHFTMFTYL